MNGAGGLNGHGGKGQPEIHTQILRALEAVHDPRSTNPIRQDASRYLEEVKTSDEAPFHGFGLASSNEQPPIVRHYGLSLIECAVRQRWSEYTPEQSQALRDWVVTLSHSTDDRDPSYITNKMAEIWVEVAKRSWGLDWMDMDEVLVRLWDGPVAQKNLVLTILETLSDEIFGTEDTTVALRGSDLGRACVEIFTPAQVLNENFPARETIVNTRYGSEGWLSRMADLLNWCIGNGKSYENQWVCAVRILVTFKSVIGWIIPRALVTTQTVQRICAGLAVSNIPTQLVGYPQITRRRTEIDHSF